MPKADGVSTPRSNLLRVHRDEPPPAPAPKLAAGLTVARIAEALERATGWSLRAGAQGDRPPRQAAWKKEVPGSDARSAQSLWLEPARGISPTCRAIDIACLGEAIFGLLADLHSARTTIWQREAELATHIPVVIPCDDEAKLAKRLAAVLRGTAEAIGCQAAGLYVLDDATTELKLRSAWGLPTSRLSEPARSLRGATADLEALLGHAVALDTAAMVSRWNAPEDFGAAVCVPIATASTPLGTLWTFSREERPFSDAETNLLELSAGRLAVELEREVLVREKTTSRRRDLRQEQLADRLRQRLPQPGPHSAAWEVTGWTSAGDMRTSFHDWQVLGDDTVSIAIGAAMGEDLPAVFTTESLLTSLRSHRQYRHGAGTLLERVAREAYASSTGGEEAILGYARLSPHSSRVTFAGAGPTRAVIIRRESVQIVGGETPLLGHEPPEARREFARVLHPGEMVILTTPNLLPSGDLEAWSRDLAKVARKRRRWKDVAAALREHFGEATGSVVVARKK